MNFLKLLPLFLIFAFVSCSSGGQQSRAEIRNLVLAGNFEGALNILEDSKFYKSKKGRTLYRLERGMIEHLRGNYFQSVKQFEKAFKRIEEQIELRISGKILQAIFNDNYDQYIVPPHELSGLHLVQTLNYFLIYQQGNYEAYDSGKDGDKKHYEKKTLTESERREELFKARSQLVAWNLLLENFKRDFETDKEGPSIYKDDLMAKLLGAQIHEAIDTVNDRQIALQLYRDAHQVLIKGYGAYETFNLNATNFRNNYKKIMQNSYGKNPLEGAQGNFNPTLLGKMLKDYIDYKILVSTKNIRPSDWDMMVAYCRPTQEIISQVLNTKGAASNRLFVMAQDLIPPKIPIDYYYSLRDALASGEPSVRDAADGFGDSFLLGFAGSKLKLLGGNIAFQLPVITSPAIGEYYQVVIKDKNDIQNKNLLISPLVLVNDMGAIAAQTLTSENTTRYVRTGLRLAVKHLAAIASSIATYQIVKNQHDKNNPMAEMGAQMAAYAVYMGASKAIKASEKADTRHWTTLPKAFRLIDMQVPNGDYELSIVQKNVNGPNDLKLNSLARTFSVSEHDTNKNLSMFYKF